MNLRIVSRFALLAAACSVAAAALPRQASSSVASPPKAPAAAPAAAVSPASRGADVVTGDYVEARTASVFAGACHFNGEVVTTGRDAIMAWDVTGGAWDGTPLAGVRAMAAVSSDANLGEGHADRKCELLIDASASPAQAKAFASWASARLGASLGTVAGVRRGSIEFRHADRAYAVSAPGFASLSVAAMPGNACCTQPELVWYAPLMPLEHRKVGYTAAAAYESGKVGDAWRRGEENSAFYGSFAD